MRRARNDYNSKKWTTSCRMFCPPSISRSYLSEALALGFEDEQRERWLELSTSSTPPSKVPPGPMKYEKKEEHVENRASFFRMKSCPPDFILKRMDYNPIIERNKNFVLECRASTAPPRRLPNGDSFRGFLLGSRYTSARHVDSVLVKNQDLPRSKDSDSFNISHKSISPGLPDGSAASKSTRRGSSAAAYRVLKYNKKTSQKRPSSESAKNQGRILPHPFTVFGSNTPTSSHSDKTVMWRKGFQGSGREKVTSTKSSRVSSPSSKLESDSSNELVGTEEGAFLFRRRARGSSVQKPVKQVEENDDFISAEAQKLTGEILQDSQDVKSSRNSIIQDLEGTVTHKKDLRSQDNRPKLSAATIEALEGVTSPKTLTGDRVAETPVIKVYSDEMASKSSTIFVDMSGLTSVETLEMTPVIDPDSMIGEGVVTAQTPAVDSDSLIGEGVAPAQIPVIDSDFMIGEDSHVQTPVIDSDSLIGEGVATAQIPVIDSDPLIGEDTLTAQTPVIDSDSMIEEGAVTAVIDSESMIDDGAVTAVIDSESMIDDGAVTLPIVNSNPMIAEGITSEMDSELVMRHSAVIEVSDEIETDTARVFADPSLEQQEDPHRYY